MDISIGINKDKKDWIENFNKKMEPICIEELKAFGQKNPSDLKDGRGYYRGNINAENNEIIVIYNYSTNFNINEGGASMYYCLKGEITGDEHKTMIKMLKNM